MAAGVELHYDTPGQIVLSVLDDALRGDFDGSGVVDLTDADLLTSQIALGKHLSDANGLVAFGHFLGCQGTSARAPRRRKVGQHPNLAWHAMDST